MKHLLEQESTGATILIMGATGTGKSSFINLLTNDDNIHIGHNQQSETFGVQTAHCIDQATGRYVMLIDTPGFDDSREYVTDTDLLEKIVRFLEPESGERINVTGIIYMHRISDPRVSGISRKNLRMFYALCGEENLGNVRIVTTNWSRVTEQEGNHREADLKNGAFKALIDAGAQMHRHANTLESAHQIMSELAPLGSVTMKIQEEVHAGKKLADTGAGKVLTAEMQEMEKKYERELADLEREMNDAEEEKNRSLIAELEQERKVLEAKMKRGNADRKKLEATLGAVHVYSAGEQGKREGFAKLRERNKDASEALKTVEARLKDPEHQAANRSSELNEAMLSDIVERDVTEHEDTAQLSRGEFPGTRSDALRMQESQAAELHLRNTEMNLQVLQARIRDAERGERSRALLNKMGLCWLGDLL